jgi:hypothetical protein
VLTFANNASRQNPKTLMRFNLIVRLEEAEIAK